MKHLLKKTISVILLISFLASQAVIASAQNTDYKLSYTINADGETVTVTGFEIEPSGEYDLVIPRKVIIDGKPYIVTEIADGVTDSNGCSKSIFGGTRINGVNTFNTTLKSVKFPDTLKRIGDGAFFGCEKLTELEFPDRLESIGVQAFRLCTNISSMGVLPRKIKEIGELAFGDLETLGNVIAYPSNVPVAARVFQSSLRGKNKNLYASLIINEGTDSLPSSIWRCNWLETLVLPSTLKKIEIDPFMNDELKRLQSVYILSDELKWNEKKTILTGTAAKTPPTKWYVLNDAVAADLTDRGIDESNIIVLTEKVVILSESDESYSVNNVDGDSFTLPTPVRDGYRFVCWTDGAGDYQSGEEYPVSHSTVLQAVWEKNYEKDTVLYRKATAKLGVATLDNHPVSKIICENLAQQTVDVYLTDENGFEEDIIARFDENGEWRNMSNDCEYTQVRVASENDFDVLYESEDNFEAVISLKEPEVIAYPRADGVSALSDFNWSSSDVTVAKVTDGAVAGLKSGTAIITAEYGSKIFSFKVNVKGEIALAKENGNEAEYLISKKSITDAILKAVKDEDKDSLIAVLTSTGENKLSDIKDIYTEDIDAADADYVEKLAERVMTYVDLTFDEIDDMLVFGEILAKEFAVGKLNGLQSVSDVDKTVQEYNGYYDFDTANKYYKTYKEKILEKFLNYTALNYDKAHGDFNEFLVLTAVENAASYTSMQETIEDLSDEIDYNKTHFNENSCYEMYREITENKDGYASIEELKNFIDGYSKPKKDNDSDSGSGGGGSRSRTLSVSLGNSDILQTSAVDDTSPLFSDVENGRWSHAAIAYLISKGAISGYGDNTFKPETSITRAEFVKIAASAFSLVYEKPDGVDETQDSFALSDVSESDWYYPYVRGAADAKAVTGDNNGRFNPNDKISREEAAAIILRIASIKGINADAGTKIEIKDISDISDWAYTSVIQLMKMGIISGYSDGTFRPNGDITREEASKLIYELMYKMNGGVKID